jgi:hypothetical protein
VAFTQKNPAFSIGDIKLNIANSGQTETGERALKKPTNKTDDITNSLSIVEIPGNLEAGRYYHQSIGVGDNIDPQTVVGLASDYKFHQIVQTSSTDTELEMLTAEIMLNKSDLFVQNPLSSILDPAQAGPAREREVRSFMRQFKQANEKRQILHDLREFVSTVSTSASLNSEIAFAADELFTNAVYNAPHVKFSENGPGAPRTSEFGDAPGLLPGELFAGFSNTRIVIGCADYYGTLNPNHIIKLIMDCYEKGVRNALNFGPGGAGLGTFLIYQSALSFYVGVTQQKKTVVCCSFSLEKRAKVRAQLPKNLHICTGQSLDPESSPSAE